jgi:protocatechuate 3,4-dioxygenase beta subunit
MRSFIAIALLGLSSSASAADPAQYKFTFTLKVGDASPVMLSAAVPPATSHRLQATEHLKFEIDAPTGKEEWPATVVRLVDDSSGKPVVLVTRREGAPATTERVSTYTVCTGRVIVQSPSPPQPASCDGLLPMAKPDPVLGRCGDCIAPYEGLPENLTARARIAPASEPGEPLVLSGRVLGPDGKPRSNVIVYAYQTDAKGIYPAPNPPRSTESNHQGRLRAWTLTDARGRYTFETIRPGSYPDTTEPQHIHMHVIERGCATYFIDEVLFTDDPMLTPEKRERISHGFGGNAIVTPKREGAGKPWQVVRDIHLGQNIPGYTACTAKAGN